MPASKPPKWAERILEWFLPDHLFDEIAGDLEEAFHWRVGTRGHQFARRMYYWEVLRSSPRYRFKTQNSSNTMLIKNYLKTGVRFLWKTRSYSSFNILGLSIGLAVAWLSAVYLTEELTYDRYHEKAPNIYRGVANFQHADQIHHLGGASYKMGEVYPKELPEIESFTRFKSWYVMIGTGEGFSVQVAHRADPGIFDLFTFNFISGTPFTTNSPDEVVLSKSMSEKLSNPSEITLRTYDGAEIRYRVSGIFQDLPTNSTIRPDVLVSMDNYARFSEGRLDTWFDINMNVFYELNGKADPGMVEQKMTDILYRYEDFEEDQVQVRLQPLLDIHTSEEYESGNGLETIANNDLIYLVMVIGIFCFVISAINYANFSLSNYLVRLREVGVRKIFGARNGKVFQQFIVETLLSVVIAFGLAFVFLLVLAPIFSDYAEKNYQLITFFQPAFLLIGLTLVIIVALISGAYPAFILSRFRLIPALHGKLKRGGKSYLNRILIALQFGLAVFLITGMIIFGQQMERLTTHDPGFTTENILIFNIPNPDEQLVEQVHAEMEGIAGVQAVTRFSGNNRTSYKDGDVQFEPFHTRIDESYLDLLEIPLMEGRNFQADRSSDKNAIIVNEAFVREAGLTNPVGKRIPFSYGALDNPEVIGVVKDYHFLDLTYDMAPLVLYTADVYRYHNFLIKAESKNIAFINQVDRLWRDAFDPYPFDYASLQSIMTRDYQVESQVYDLTRYGAIISILLACMGLLGTVGTHVRQRMKEVSIRKINGATPKGLFFLFVKRYFPLTIIGIISGIGLAYDILGKWLDRYTVRIEPGLGIAAVAMLLVLIIALMTMWSQLYRAIYVNPVNYLRDE
jgi:putative ABC transport system permease protein